jgi:hypothetical protein
VSTEPTNVDVEEFKDKFPFTLDVVPPPTPEPSLPRQRGASSPRQKPKTIKEIEDEQFAKKNKEDLK